MGFLRVVPLIGIVAAIYAGFTLLGVDVAASHIASFTLPSGTTWNFSIADLLLLLGIVSLYLEVLKATRTSQASIADHILSLLVFVALLIGFLLVPKLGTSVFLLLTIMAMFDLIAGFTITISSARRDLAFSHDHHP